MKSEIHEFPIGIYPRKLWVSVGASDKELSDFFGETIEPMAEDCNADTTNVVKHKPKPRGGILIRFPSRKEMTPSNIAHEATHFAIEVFDYTDCRIDAKNQEPFAYLLGWAVDMMDKVRRNKYEED